ncbi:hypothetical protein WR25_14363 [Diploscapter pachys]|uniref:DM domain-containing protein n=1 Tax=Diploscapter pachys TaxID=2018661 RepID=A0A2A2J299_9BILA|nr:hypothetical protein WR25_14363 [Diploscapter pachys]
MTASVTGGSEDGRLSVNSTEDRDNLGSSKGGKGRILYCRKCEGHGEKVILKNHSPTCPYILCACKSCEKLNSKRLKSFNKRNKEKLVLAAALNAQRKTNTDTAIAISDDEESRRSSFSSNGKTPSPSSGMENSEDKRNGTNKEKRKED